MIKNKLFIFILIAFFFSCNHEKQWEGQKPIKEVSTQTAPVQLQHKEIFDLGEGVYVSNRFAGARLNGIARSNDTLLTVLITPENTPINISPWYAFKIWSENEQKLYLKLTYPEPAHHRYFPKLSYDGQNWTPLDSLKYQANTKVIDDGDQVTTDIVMQLNIGPDTLWVSAQEVITSSFVDNWMNQLEALSFVSKSIIGQSHEERPIYLLRIGESDDRKMILVLSRQHPPEVTGFLAMKSFVETLCSNSKLATEFRSKYNAYVIPLVNPDGVDNGQWRHNKGGVDLNRDWKNFNQPETSAIRDFMKKKTTTGSKFYFAVDFHSTFEDIYYTIDPELKGNMPGLVPKLIASTAAEFDNYTPNIKPGSETDVKITSTAYFFYEYGAESLTFEIGDNTTRDFVQQKGRVSAEKLMELLVK